MAFLLTQKITTNTSLCIEWSPIAILKTFAHSFEQFAAEACKTYFHTNKTQ